MSKRRLRILHTVEFYYPNLGGSQVVVQQLSEHLVKMGHDVTVATSADPKRDFTELNGVKVESFDVQGNEVLGMRGKDIERYKKFLQTGKFDIIMNLNTQVWPTDLCFDVANKLQAKLVLAPIGFSEINNPAFANYYEKVDKIVRKHYVANIFISTTFRDIVYAREHGWPRVTTIFNAANETEFGKVDEGARQWVRETFGIPQNRKIVLYVANFSGEKGQLELIKAFFLLPLRNVDLLLLGMGDMFYGDLNKAIVAKGVLNKLMKPMNKRIHIYPGIRERVVGAYFASDIFAMPSHVECSPVTLMEAAAAGLPFVATDTGNNAELAKITGAGIITPTIPAPNGRVHASIPGLARSMFTLLTSHKTRKRLGEAGRKNWQQKFTWKEVAKQYEQLYQDITK